MVAEPELEKDIGGLPIMWSGLVVLSVIGRGKKVLALGCNAADIALAARRFGSEAASSELFQASPCASKDSSKPSGLRLHYGDEEFDTVFVNGLEWLADPNAQGMDSSTAQKRLLTECYRVLRADGVLVSAMENRFGVRAWMRKRHPSAGTYHSALLPRRVSRLLSDDYRKQAYAPYSGPGWGRLLRRSGFEPRDRFTLWPSIEEWEHIVPVFKPRTSGVGEPNTTGRMAWVDKFLSGFRLVGLQHLVVPNYLIVATKKSARALHEIQPTLLDNITAVESERLGTSTSLSSFPASDSICCIIGTQFIKIPLTTKGLRKVSNHAHTTEILFQHPIGKYVPLPAKIKSFDGIHYMSCPAIRNDGVEVRRSDLERIGLALSQNGCRMELSETDFWKRIFDHEVHHHLERFEGAAVLDHVAHSLSGRQISAGIHHGDLHLKNLIRGAERTFVIDWDRFEERSPQFLDTMELTRAILLLEGNHCNHQIIHGYAPYFLANYSHLPLNQLLDRYEDEFSTHEKLVCYLLHLMSAGVRSRSPSIFHCLPYKRWFAYCEQLLGLHIEEEI